MDEQDLLIEFGTARYKRAELVCDTWRETHRAPTVAELRAFERMDEDAYRVATAKIVAEAWRMLEQARRQ